MQASQFNRNRYGGDGEKDTPVSIPNTVVKLFSAEDNEEPPCESRTLPCLFFIKYSAIAQSVERMTVNHDVTGSSPVCGVIGAIAQLAEHVIEAHGVGSSILSCAIYGGVAKWLNAADCKSALIEFGSSNLSPSILYFGGCGEVVNASGCGPDIRGFDSLQPPYF